MNHFASQHLFQPASPDAAGVISWVHLGDLHMTRSGEQNHLDLAQIVDEMNRAFAGSVSFIFLPGDVADDGSQAAYTVVRGELDRLQAPWCAILGDHDVHEKSFANFLQAMTPSTHYAFPVGRVRFVAMNAFDVPHPGSFVLSEQQLDWVKNELRRAADAGETAILLLHCYPSDLKSGGRELAGMVGGFGVRLIDMGHTHYNEIANDGTTLYTATRSTGQIEEGPVGYSITSLDGEAISWRFVALGKLPVAMITFLADERLMTNASERLQGDITVRAKVWSEAETANVHARFHGQTVTMRGSRTARFGRRSWMPPRSARECIPWQWKLCSWAGRWQRMRFASWLASVLSRSACLAIRRMP